jgi:hypothetical protein
MRLALHAAIFPPDSDKRAVPHLGSRCRSSESYCRIAPKGGCHNESRAARAYRAQARGNPGGRCRGLLAADGRGRGGHARGAEGDPAPEVRDKLDFAFEDLGEQQVKNISRPVRIYRIPIAENATAKAPLPLPEKPSLAVPPFQNMTGDEQDYFVDGIVKEITTAISRLPWLFVIARNSSFTYKRPGGRREAGGPRVGRAVRARRQRAPRSTARCSRQSGPRAWRPRSRCG